MVKKRMSVTTVIIAIIIIVLLAIGGYFVFKKSAEKKEAKLEFATAPDYSTAYKPADAIQKSTDVNVFDTKTNPFEEK